MLGFRSKKWPTDGDGDGPITRRTESRMFQRVHSYRLFPTVCAGESKMRYQTEAEGPSRAEGQQQKPDRKGNRRWYGNEWGWRRNAREAYVLLYVKWSGRVFPSFHFLCPRPVLDPEGAAMF